MEFLALIVMCVLFMALIYSFLFHESKDDVRYERDILEHEIYQFIKNESHHKNYIEELEIQIKDLKNKFNILCKDESQSYRSLQIITVCKMCSRADEFRAKSLAKRLGTIINLDMKKIELVKFGDL